METSQAFIGSPNEGQIEICPVDQGYATVDVTGLSAKVSEVVGQVLGADVGVEVVDVSLQNAWVTFSVSEAVTSNLLLELRRAHLEQFFDMIPQRLIGRLEMAVEMAAGDRPTEEIWRALRVLAAVELPD